MREDVNYMIKIYCDKCGKEITDNVNTVTEMTNLIDSTRAYEANATAFEASKSMAQTGLSIGQ